MLSQLKAIKATVKKIGKKIEIPIEKFILVVGEKIIQLGRKIKQSSGKIAKIFRILVQSSIFLAITILVIFWDTANPVSENLASIWHISTGFIKDIWPDDSDSNVASDDGEAHSIEGIWQGKFDINGRGNFDYTALHVDGKVVGVSNDANVVYQGTVSNVDIEFHSQMNTYAKNKYFLSKMTITGIITDANEIKNIFRTADNDTGRLTLIRQEQQYQRATSLDDIAGQWILHQGREIIKFTIAGDGDMRGEDTIGCVYKGEITVIDPEHNAYEMNILISFCFAEGRFSGMAYLSSSIEEDDTLNLHLFGDDKGLFLPIMRNRYASD